MAEHCLLFKYQRLLLDLNMGYAGKKIFKNQSNRVSSHYGFWYCTKRDRKKSGNRIVQNFVPPTCFTWQHEVFRLARLTLRCLYSAPKYLCKHYIICCSAQIWKRKQNPGSSHCHLWNSSYHCQCWSLISFHQSKNLHLFYIWDNIHSFSDCQHQNLTTKF